MKTESQLQYENSPKLCEHCKLPIPYNNRNGKYCSQSCSAIRRNLGRKMPKETRQKISKTMDKKVLDGTFKIPNAHLKNIRIEKICQHCKTVFKAYPSQPDRKYCSKACFVADPDKKTGPGGYRKGSGNGKKGWYKGYWCDSSYELAYVIYNIDHNISITRNKQGFEYEWEGEKHLYYPDFMISDGSYVEIKGFRTDQHEAKILNFPYKLTVLFRKDLETVINYVESKYGKDFIKLYEGNPYNELKNICQNCSKVCVNIFCSQTCAGKFRAKINHSK